MEPGRELDALIAEKLMGFDAHCFVDDEGQLRDAECEAVPSYSTSIAAAWEVWEFYGNVELKTDFSSFYRWWGSRYFGSRRDSARGVCLFCYKMNGRALLNSVVSFLCGAVASGIFAYATALSEIKTLQGQVGIIQGELKSIRLSIGGCGDDQSSE